MQVDELTDQKKGLTITSPKEGDIIDIQQGLRIAWDIDDGDNLDANLTIELYLQNYFQQILTEAEHGGAVPIKKSEYIFQYRAGYIHEAKKYVIHIYENSTSEHESGEFEITNTADFVTSVLSAPASFASTATPRGSIQSPSASASAVAVRTASTSITIQHHSPTASSNVASNMLRPSSIEVAIWWEFIAPHVLWILVLLYTLGILRTLG